MGHYTLSDVAQAFSEENFDQGWTHHRNRQVRDMEFHENGRALTGNVLGNHGVLYKQSVRIVNDGRGGAKISGSCTCHAGSECRHIAALLIEGLARPETRIKGDVLEPGFLGWVGALEEAVLSGADEEYAASVRYRLLTLGTVEERILELQDRALMGGVVKTNATGQLSAEDMDALLAPLS